MNANFRISIDVWIVKKNVRDTQKDPSNVYADCLETSANKYNLESPEVAPPKKKNTFLPGAR